MYYKQKYLKYKLKYFELKYGGGGAIPTIFGRNLELIKKTAEATQVQQSTVISHPTASHPTASHPTAPHPTAPHPTAPHPTAPHPTSPHPTASHPTASHPTAPHPTASHPTAPQAKQASQATAKQALHSAAPQASHSAAQHPTAPQASHSVAPQAPQAKQTLHPIVPDDVKYRTTFFTDDLYKQIIVNSKLYFYVTNNAHINNLVSYNSRLGKKSILDLFVVNIVDPQSKTNTDTDRVLLENKAAIEKYLKIKDDNFFYYLDKNDNLTGSFYYYLKNVFNTKSFIEKKLLCDEPTKNSFVQSIKSCNNSLTKKKQYVVNDLLKDLDKNINDNCDTYKNILNFKLDIVTIGETVIYLIDIHFLLLIFIYNFYDENPLINYNNVMKKYADVGPCLNKSVKPVDFR